MTRDRGYRVHVATTVPTEPEVAWCSAGRMCARLLSPASDEGGAMLGEEGAAENAATAMTG